MRRGPLLPTLACGAAALALRLAHAVQAEAPTPVLDQARFLAQAASIRAGDGPGEGPYATSPLYPYLLALLGDGARLTQLALGAGTAALVALAATRRAGPVAGWIAGLLVATSGPAVHYEGQLLVAGPLAFLLALALALAPDEPGPRESLRGGAAGVALGLAAALRPTALAPALALAAVSLARGRRRAAAALGIGLALTVLPFTLRNTLVGGEPVLLTTGGGFNLWVGNHAGAPGVFEAPPGYDLALDPVGAELARRESGEDLDAAGASAWWRGRALEGMGAGLFLRKLALALHPEEIPQLGPDDFRPARREAWWLRLSLDARWVLLLALLAPLAAPRERIAAPCAMAAAYGAVLVLFFVSGRFRLPMMPVAAVLAGASLAHARARPRLLGLAGLVLASTSLLVYRAGGPFSLGEADTRAAAPRALAQEGRYGEAADALRALLAEDPTYARAALDLGRLLLGPLLGTTPEQKRAAWSEAAAALERAVVHQPQLGEAWFYLGVARLNLGQRGAAAEALEEALRHAAPQDDWRSEAARALAAARG